MNIASPGYFATLGIPLVDGRDFAIADGADSRPVAIVNNEMAKYWSGGALGREVSFDSGKTWVSIVGVSGDTRQFTASAGRRCRKSSSRWRSRPVWGDESSSGPMAIRRSSQARCGGRCTMSIPTCRSRTSSPCLTFANRRWRRARLTAVLLLIFALIALTVTLAGVPE